MQVTPLPYPSGFDRLHCVGPQVPSHSGMKRAMPIFVWAQQDNRTAGEGIRDDGTRSMDITDEWVTRRS